MESKVAKNTYNCRDFMVSLLGNSTAIKQLLQQHILAAIYLSKPSIVVANLPDGTQLTPEMIPLYRLSDDTRVLYRCAIALKLAPLWQLSAIDIASQLLASFPALRQDTASQYLDFSAKVVSPGWIDFELSDPGLAVWLQQMIELPLSRQEGKQESSFAAGELHQSLKEAPNLFPVQYAHARCCSLLRLAQGQGLIKLRDLGFQSVSWHLVEPNPIPWLDDDQAAETGTLPLRLVHLAERGLIAQLLDLQAEINDSKPLNLVKLGSASSKAFEMFYSHCRIWGEVKTQTPKLAQARLGLVAVTQISLRSLLQDQLGVPAPVEL